MSADVDAKTVRCFVKGRVQGVWYRASTQRQAQSLGLSGYVRNLADGTVEVVARGPAETVDTLIGWLWAGPDGAEVTGVVVETFAGEFAEGFTIERGL